MKPIYLLLKDVPLLSKNDIRGSIFLHDVGATSDPAYDPDIVGRKGFARSPGPH